MDIGGVLTVKQNLTIRSLEVGGKCKIGGILSADKVDIGGWIEAAEIKGDSVEVGGSLITEKGTKADSITIGDRGRVKGPLIGDTIEIGEKCDVEAIYAKTVTIGERTKAELVQGVDVRIESGCRITGEVRYTESLDADEDVSFEVNPEKVASLPEPPS